MTGMTSAALLTLLAIGAGQQHMGGLSGATVGTSIDMQPHDAAGAASPEELNARARQAQGTPSRRDRAVAALPADLVANAAVFDTQGRPLGTIDRVEGAGAIVASPGGRVSVPVNAFGKNARGLMLGIAKPDFDKLVAGATGAPATE